MTTAKRCSGLLAFLATLVVGSPARADSAAIDFEDPPYTTGSINGQDGWSATGAYDYGVVLTSGFGSPSGFAAQSFRISNAITSGSFGDWAFSKSLGDEAGEPTAANGGFSGGTRQSHFEVSFDIASAVPGSEQTGLQISVAPDRGDGARMSFLRFRDTSGGIDIDFADYQDVAPFGTSSNLAAGCGGADDFITTTVATELDRSVPHNVKLVMDFVPGPRNDVVRVFVDGALVHCGTTWEDYFRYCEATDDSRTVDSLLLQARSGGGTAPATLGFGFLVDNLDLMSGPPVDVPAVCPAAAAPCAAAACATPNCFVDDATGLDAPGCCAGAPPCKTIKFAVSEASPGDVVSVGAGTYPEPGTLGGPLTINKALTLCGAQAGNDARTRGGPETEITDPEGTVISDSDVVIDGFTIKGNVSPAFVYGLDMAQGTTGTQVYNNILEDNIAGIGLANTGVSQVRICQNLIQNNNVPGPATGNGIYTDEFVCGFALPCTNFLIEENAFESNDTAGVDISNLTKPLSQLDISTNTFNNGRAVLLFNADQVTIHNNEITNANFAVTGSGAIRLFGGADDVSITNNDFDAGNGWAIRITDSGFGTGPSSDVVIHQNNIANFFGDGGPFGGGLFVGTASHVGPVDAECNWWNDPCGPYNVAANPGGVGEEVREEGAAGDADFTPWLVAVGPAPGVGSGMCSGIMCVATTSTSTSTSSTSSTSTPSTSSTSTSSITTTSSTSSTSTTPTTTSTSSSTPTTTLGTTTTTQPGLLNHFQCYEVRPPQAFSATGIGLVDQYGSLTVDLTKAFSVCAPADKNGEDPTAVSDPGHLTSYGIRGPRFARVFGQQVRDQFGTQILDVVKPARLLVPSSKGLSGPPAPLDGGPDHFTCYKAKKARGSARFTKQTGVQIETQFETASIDIIKPRRLCVPADKNGESPDAENHPDVLLCYRVRSTGTFAPLSVHINNQFGQQEYLISQRREFCAPAVIEPPYGSPSRAFLARPLDLLE